MPQENVDVVLRTHELYRAGEFDVAIDEYLDPAIEWETRWPGLPNWFRGRDGVREWVRRVLEPMQIEMDLIDARSLDDEVVLARYIAHGRGRSSDVSTEMKIFDLLWVRNGLIHRRRTFYSEEEALEAVGL